MYVTWTRTSSLGVVRHMPIHPTPSVTQEVALPVDALGHEGIDDAEPHGTPG